ncbi:cell division protein FtsL [Defluviimonas sp. D31]|uniref:cell division protein FtsL n=1 Tax=Defluviimonas sp. D31 TaxID=3083253 RepID=UPI00296E53F6|nr:cell division protein FtsL [Defluviimonas sp. D31]MDW4549842.1 cell division protein FtsL [Defluviimonas sp. D31]
MRSLFLVLTALAVMGLAFWAYRENYRTQAELAAVRNLQSEIGVLKESLGVLNAEWAYLNRPDRLRELADISFPRLGLLPLEPRQFGGVAQIGYPEIELPSITFPVDTIALGETNP